MTTAIDRLAPNQPWASAVARWTIGHSMWHYPLDLVKTTLNVTANALAIRPLAWLYLQGPRAIGFWGGLAPGDICAQLTNTHAEFWQQSEGNQQECMDTIYRHFWSWLVLGTTVSYFLIVFVLLWTCWKRRFGQRPLPPQIVVVHSTEKNQNPPEQ